MTWLVNHIKPLVKALTLLIVLISMNHNGKAQYISINGAYFTVSGSTNLSADTINNSNSATLANGGKLTLHTVTNSATSQGNGTYNIAKGFANTGTFTANSSTVNYTGNSNQNVAAVTYNNLTLSGTGSTKTAVGNSTVNGTLTIGSADTLDMVTSVIDGTFSTSGTGLFKTQSTSSTPVPSDKTWTGPVYYNASSAQTVIARTYVDLNATGGNRTLDASTIKISGTF